MKNTNKRARDLKMEEGWRGGSAEQMTDGTENDWTESVIIDTELREKYVNELKKIITDDTLPKNIISGFTKTIIEDLPPPPPKKKKQQHQQQKKKHKKKRFCNGGEYHDG